MKHLVFVGPQGSGKTSSVARIARELDRLGYEVISELKAPNDKSFYGVPTGGGDFYVVFKKDGKYVLCYSWSDNESLVQWLGNFIRGLIDKGINLTLVVMASRPAPEWLYGRTELAVGLTNENRIQIPLAKITARNDRPGSLRFYHNTVFNLVSTQILPALL